MIPMLPGLRRFQSEAATVGGGSVKIPDLSNS
jgi:hypothetical protein